MKKPERMKAQYGDEEYPVGYNQGLKDMEAYYEATELSEGEIKSMIKKWFREYWDNVDGIIKELAQAIISAQNKKRR